MLREKQRELQQSFYVKQNQKILCEPVGLNFSVHEAKNFNPNMGSGSAVLDFDKIQFPLELRRWRKGDVFKPLGMRGKKKLSDFFVDQKKLRHRL